MRWVIYIFLLAICSRASDTEATSTWRKPSSRDASSFACAAGNSCLAAQAKDEASLLDGLSFACAAGNSCLAEVFAACARTNRLRVTGRLKNKATSRRKNRRVNTDPPRSEEHTSELQSRLHLVCRLLLEKKKKDPHTNSQTQLVTRHTHT